MHVHVIKLVNIITSTGTATYNVMYIKSVVGNIISFHNPQVYRQRSGGVLSVDLLSFDGRGAGGKVMGECSSVINMLIERGVAVMDSRKWGEPSSLSVNLGSGDCLDVMVPTAENPWDFHVHLVGHFV